jgi:hypothetical protein
MRKSLTLAGALLALAAFASTADARMGGGGMSSSMSHGDMRGSSSPSLGSPRGTFGNGGRSFDVGLQTRDRGSHWKHPIDSDQGGPDDPPKKTPNGGTGTGGSPPKYNAGDHYGPHKHHPGYVDKYGHYHPADYGNSSASNDPAPASRTPR